MQKRHESNVKKLYPKKSSINGVGLYTREAFSSGNFIAFIKGPEVRIDQFSPKISKRTIDWIGTSKYTWIDTSNSPFKYINHSCDPNCYITGKRSVFALKNIPSDTEITLDYSLNETEENWKISSCNCGAKNCRGVILPITKLNAKVFEEKKHIIHKTFRNIFLNTNS